MTAAGVDPARTPTLLYCLMCDVAIIRIRAAVATFSAETCASITWSPTCTPSCQTSPQASTQDTLATLNQLVCHPLYTLYVGSAFKPQLLRLVSALVDHHVQQHAQPSSNSAPHNAHAAGGLASFSVALLCLLELAPHVDRCVWE